MSEPVKVSPLTSIPILAGASHGAGIFDAVEPCERRPPHTLSFLPALSSAFRSRNRRVQIPFGNCHDSVLFCYPFTRTFYGDSLVKGDDGVPSGKVNLIT